MTHRSRNPRRRRGTPRLLVLLGGAASALVACLWWAAPAQAHAVLVNSNPVDGSRVAHAPDIVVLTFDEPVQLVPGTAVVVSTSGQREDAPGARVSPSGNQVLIPLQPRLPKGSYFVTWRVISADSHVVAGSIAFGVRQPVTQPPPTTTSPRSSLDVAAGVARTLGYLGLVLVIGLPAAAMAVWAGGMGSRRIRILLAAGWLLVVGTTLLELLAEGPRARGSGWRGLVRLDGLAQTLSSEFGHALVAQLLIMAAAVPVLAQIVRHGPLRRWPLALALGTGSLVAAAAAGHAVTGTDPALALTSTTMHLAGMALWLGGLVYILIDARPGAAHATQNDLGALRRWSKVAFCCVAVVIVTGEYQAWRMVQPLPALWSTSYGRILLIKLCLIATTLTFAYGANRRVQSSATRDPVRVVTAVRRSIRLELAAAGLVLLTTSVLVSQPPASATYGPPTSLSAPLGQGRSLKVHIDPTRTGSQTIEIQPIDANGELLHLQSLSATLSSPEIAALKVRVQRTSGDNWRALTIVPTPGTWTLTFNVSITRADGAATAVTYTAW